MVTLKHINVSQWSILFRLYNGPSHESERFVLQQTTVRGSPVLPCVQTGAPSEGQFVEQCNILILGISENYLL
jgi:hypothetical protein